MPQHFYGYKKDRFDTRDYRYQIRLHPMARPPAVDLRPSTSSVRDQGNLGSCVGFAAATGMREFLENTAKQSLTVMSPLFLYYQCRVIEGTVGEDVGAEPRDVMKVLVGQGCAPEADWPYVISKFTKAPSAQAVKNAKTYTVASYHRLANLDEALDCLAGGSGLVIGFDVYASFEDIGANGDMPMPQSGEQLLGGHAVFVVGYKLDPTCPGGGYLIVKNSWGAGWGDHGYFYMPFAFVTPANVSDMWVAVGNAPVPVPPTPTPTPTPVPTPPAWLADFVKKLEELLVWLKAVLGL
jgi:C1A family cysteine protease